MSIADIQYNRIVKTILEDGTFQNAADARGQWADGSPALTKRILNKQLQFDGNEVPILTSKYVQWKSAIKELLWIWQMKSNRVQDLRDMGVHIWDKWEFAEGEWKGTIGPAYGYQLGKKCRTVKGEKLDQVDYILQSSLTGRRNLTSLWGIEDLDQMALEPCVWSTQWVVENGQLHLVVIIRSNDVCLGNPFNMFQYHVLQRMVCQVKNIPIGTLTFKITDAHIYDRHIPMVMEQMKEETFDAPELIIDPSITNFYDFKPEHFNLVNYNYSKPRNYYNYELAE